MAFAMSTAKLCRLPLAACCIWAASLVPGFAASVQSPKTIARNSSADQMRDLIERYTVDRATLEKSDQTPLSPIVRSRMRSFYSEWERHLTDIDFDALDQDGRIDYFLLKNHLTHALRGLQQQQKQVDETEPLLPFAPVIVKLAENLRQMEDIDPQKAAAELDRLNKQIDQLEKSISTLKQSKYIANRAANQIDQLKAVLKTWFDFYNGYDPLFTWWTAETYRALDANLQTYASEIREQVVGIKPGDKTTIIGNPIGREALMNELASEMIPYTPEQLLVLAKREFTWCENEARRASREMGDGDDWLRALEKVKSDYVPPGKQPALIRKLALEAIDFVEKHNLVTVPELARETWRMDMMTPERQLINPFFTGGDTLTVSYPTNTMSYEQKIMSMRGNNVHFARATVFHELIPGHELQGFMAQRYRAYRQIFTTPFYVEGWSLYWEMLFWDMHFAVTPEDRIGMLFWRMHRAARIIFSISFHLGKWTPQECVDFLVTKVGHERENAAAEVRRSFIGQDPPLYQAAYMLGGLQLRSLHRDLVESGKMTNREFHDAVLKENAIPIELVRADLMKEKLTRQTLSSWKFYGDLKPE
jgi:uncharacterized protein (DUF885 family)